MLRSISLLFVGALLGATRVASTPTVASTLLCALTNPERASSAIGCTISVSGASGSSALEHLNDMLHVF